MSRRHQTLSKKIVRRTYDWHDKLQTASLSAHVIVVAYVTTGWMVNSRGFLFAYLLALPSIMLQWLLNGGSSLVSNFENLARTGCWDDSGNPYQAALFQTLLRDSGFI